MVGMNTVGYVCDVTEYNKSDTSIIVYIHEHNMNKLWDSSYVWDYFFFFFHSICNIAESTKI